MRAVGIREGPYRGAVRHERFVGGWDVEDELAVLLVQPYVVCGVPAGGWGGIGTARRFLSAPVEYVPGEPLVELSATVRPHCRRGGSCREPPAAHG